MNIAIRLVSLRFDIMKKPEDQQYCPVGLFYRPEGASETSNIFIKYSNETPRLPVILAFPEMAFPYQKMNTGPLENIKVAHMYRGEYRLDEVSSVEVSDGMEKIYKFLFTFFIAESPHLADKRPIFRFKMHRYFVKSDPPKIVAVSSGS